MTASSYLLQSTSLSPTYISRFLLVVFLSHSSSIRYTGSQLPKKLVVWISIRWGRSYLINHVDMSSDRERIDIDIYILKRKLYICIYMNSLKPLHVDRLKLLYYVCLARRTCSPEPSVHPSIHPPKLRMKIARWPEKKKKKKSTILKGIDIKQEGD